MQPLETAETFAPTPTLDTPAFPHILHQIIQYSSNPTIASLLRCSKSTFHDALPFLYRNLRIDFKQLASMVEVSIKPSKQGSTSRSIGRSFSPSLLEALQQIRSIGYLRQGHCTFNWRVPRGCLDQVSTLVIHPEIGHSGTIWSDLGLTTATRTASVTALYIRISSTHLRQSDGPYYIVAQMPTHIHNVTLIVPVTADLQGLPILGVGPSHKKVPAGTIITYAMIPDPECYSATSKIWSTSEYQWAQCPHHFIPLAERCDIRVVGSEYLGLSSSEFATRLSDAMLYHYGNDHERPKFALTFMTVSEWLDELEPGTVFDEGEENEIREANRQCLARIKAERNVSLCS